MKLLINKKVLYIAGSIIAVVAISVGMVIALNLIKPKEVKVSTDQKTCPSGYVKIPGNKNYKTNDFCVMKYEAKDNNGKAASLAESAPWTDTSQIVALDLAKYACDGCRLISEGEWMTIAHNLVSNPVNWSSGKVGEGYIYSGHNDSDPATPQSAAKKDSDGYYATNGANEGSQKRTLKLSTGEVIWDFAGNAAEWTDGQMTGGQPGGVKNETSYSWKEWNQIGFEGFLPVKPFPGQYDQPAGSFNWSHEKGIGKLNSNSGDTEMRVFSRGGTSLDGDGAGVFSLNMSGEPIKADPLVGFRVVVDLK